VAVQNATLQLLPAVDQRIDDLQYENYNIPTLKYGHRVLVSKDRYVEHGNRTLHNTDNPQKQNPNLYV
jgi:hypothetical protein